ncbi:MucB/RseB C-terminal domain-containing protein [Alkalimonas sp. MEB108]|uniref:MucB/RseB C-terminal domain-containing protein n=1 Tax=Alkalimonas cellulosilytica TaxID=3058395 RepID=A0ABU7J3I6_9GAMM|nr:MucB/RseB C-terminal domain-containing protein [Alkalimonas sp. MEB108]MEE2000933.1 MucB/RseB C-terminal domain-containing protein [Alkalimonas sp. MEB108]
MRCSLLLLLVSSLLFAPLLQAESKGWQLFQQSQHAVQTNNFDASYVVIKGEQISSFRWLHGLHEQQQLEQLVPMDVDGIDILRKGKVVYYLTPEKPALVTLSSYIKELPSLLYLPIDDLRELYDPVSGSVSQMGGRSAQLLRLSAFHPGRLSYWLWLDIETGFPLRIDTVAEGHQVLERWLVTHLHISPELPASLQALLELPLPTPDHRQLQPRGSAPLASDIQLAWLPSGFKMIEDPLVVPSLGVPLLHYWLLTDGLHQVSVFVQQPNQQPPQAYRDGATTIYVHSTEQFDVTVIGPVTLEIARQIANAVRYD